MKLYVFVLLLLAINGISCAPTNDGYQEEKKYGIGADIAGGINIGAEAGVHSQDGTHSLFVDTTGRGKASAELSAFKRVKTIPNTTPNGYPIQYAPQYQMPVYYPQYPMYYLHHPVPVNVPYPQYPMTAPVYGTKI